MSEPRLHEELWAAIRAGDLEAAKRCLTAEETAAAQATDEQGVSLLLQAFYHRQPEIADLIVETRDRLGLEVDVFEAAVLGRRDRLQELTEAGPTELESISPDGFSLLHLAAFFDQPGIVQLLLERGANVHAVAANATRVQPLHSAAAVRSLEICRRLLDAGADVNARQAGGFTPLMSAAMAGDRDLVDLLLAQGADASLAAEDGRTPRDLAAAGGYESLVSLLGTAQS